MIQSKALYEEWLTTIANTRLIYNKMEKLESMLDNKSIHSNGIRRCYPEEAQQRSAFRDLAIEVQNMTDKYLDLEEVLIDYKNSWDFYRENLDRRANPLETARELLTYAYAPDGRDIRSSRKQSIFKEAVDKGMNIPMLVLFILKALPGYDSRKGDVKDNDSEQMFNKMITLMKNFTTEGTMFHLLPAIIRAEKETNKTRIMLIYHLSHIIDTYCLFSTPSELYDSASELKESRVALDIEGYWNEFEGLDITTFWQIEESADDGIYFMTKWEKKDNGLKRIQYVLCINQTTDGNLIYYMIHPKAMEHRIQGKPYEEEDHMWYTTGMLSDTPISIPLRQSIASTKWPQQILLTRCTAPAIIEEYDRYISHLPITDEFSHLAYTLHPSLYAITQDYLYIYSESEGIYYKVPRDPQYEFDKIQISDTVGILTMNGSIYLAFDELLLYIRTTEQQLQRYGITRVRSIEEKK